jgi:hypothetical protein
METLLIIVLVFVSSRRLGLGLLSLAPVVARSPVRIMRERRPS